MKYQAVHQHFVARAPVDSPRALHDLELLGILQQSRGCRVHPLIAVAFGAPLRSGMGQAKPAITAGKLDELPGADLALVEGMVLKASEPAEGRDRARHERQYRQFR